MVEAIFIETTLQADLLKAGLFDYNKASIYVLRPDYQSFKSVKKGLLLSSVQHVHLYVVVYD